MTMFLDSAGNIKQPAMAKSGRRLCSVPGCMETRLSVQ